MVELILFLVFFLCLKCIIKVKKNNNKIYEKLRDYNIIVE